MKRRWSVTLVVSAGISLTGCQTPSLGGLAFWKSGNSGSAAPDVGQQRLDGLSQQLGSDARAGGLGSAKPAASDNFLMASWKKTTAAVTGAAGAKTPLPAPEDDPLRLDRLPKRIGPEVYVGAARLLENQGKIEGAEGKYLEALQASPDDLSALVGLARLYDRAGQGAKAIDTYQLARKAHPTSSLVCNDLGLCYRRQKQLEKSLAAFRQAIELQPDNAKYRNNLAAALVEADRDDEALRALTEVSPPAVAEYNLAYLLQERGRPGDAITHLQRAVAIDPHLESAQDLLAQLGGRELPAVASQEAAAASLQTASRPAAPRITPPSITQQEALPPREAPRQPEAPPSYSSGGGDAAVYTSAPQVAAPAAVSVPSSSSSYHIGDEPAAASSATGERTRWSSAAWALPEAPAGELRLLPPTE
jgi:tetratricopeptide (TPR) repeat protein